jgi:DNA-binding MarR family transcriptional regulator
MKSISLEPVNLVGDIFANTLGVIAENMVNQEEANRGREVFETQKEAARMFNVLPQQLTPDQIRFYEQRTGKDVRKQTFTEGFNQTFDTLLRDAIDGSKAIRQGANFTELPGMQQIGVGILPLEFYFGSLGGKQAIKGINEFRKQHGGKQIAEVLNDSRIAAEFPEVIADMKAKFPMLDIGRDVTGARTTERLTDQDLVQSQMTAAEERGMRFLKGKPRPKIEKSGPLVSYQRNVKESDTLKVTKALVDDLEKGKKYSTEEELVKGIEQKSGVKNLSYKDIQNKKNDYVRKGQLKVPYSIRDAEFGILPPVTPARTETFNKLVADIKSGKVKVKPGQLTEVANKYGVNKELLRKEFPELLATEKVTGKALTQSAVSRRASSIAKVDKMIDFKNKFLQENNLDDVTFARLFDEMQRNKLQPLESKKLKEYLDSGEISQSQFDQLNPGARTTKQIDQDVDEITSIIKTKGVSNYDKANRIVRKFGLTKDSLLSKYLASSARKDLDSFADEMRAEGALTKAEFDSQPALKEIYKDRAEYNNELAEQILMKRMNKDAAEGRDFNVPLFKVTEGFRKEAAQKTEDYLKNLFLSPSQNKKILKFRDKFIKEYEPTLTNKVDLQSDRGQKEFIKNLMNVFGPQLAHSAPVKGRVASAILSDFAENVRINPGAYNVQLQVHVERRLDNHIRNLKKALDSGDTQKISKLINDIKKFNKAFKKRKMTGFYRVNDDKIIELLRKRGLNAGDRRLLLGEERNLNPGLEANNALAAVKKYFDGAIKNPNKIKFYKKDLGRPPKTKERRGLETPIRKGMPVINFDKTDLFNKGGPVRMAIGGDPLQNINQQQFAPDPAFQGQDFFQNAVDSGNLTAFNPLRLFNLFGKTKGVANKTDVGQPTTLPRADQTVDTVAREDFPFQSFTYEKIISPNAPNNALPQDWANFLLGGNQAPVSEIRDSGLEQFLSDFEKYYPGRKVSKEQLAKYYETSPVGNLSVTVKQEPTPNVPNQGRPKHKETGSQPLDGSGENYREVLVTAGEIPGEGKPFVNSAHFEEPNVIAFTRVADYKLADGSTAAVIQELQTDMLTSLRTEQQRIKALLKRLENAEDEARRKMASADNYERARGEQDLRAIESVLTPQAKELLIQSEGVKPFPNAAGQELIPGYSQQLGQLQKQIDDILAKKLDDNMPFIDEDIFGISQEQLKIRDQLLDLNRALETDSVLGGVRVPPQRQADDLLQFSESTSPPRDYELENLKLFPPVPFKKAPDYVDLIIKATIKDAQSKGINNIGLFTGELVNRRWGKDPTRPAGKKFNDLYDKIGVQQLNNIAKKYGGQVVEGEIVDSSKASKGLKFFNKNVDGELELLKDFEPSGRGTVDADDLQGFLDTEIERVALDFGPNEVVLRREIAPGQTMEYFVKTKPDDGFELVPLGDGDRAENAAVIIDEYNPSLIKIPVLKLPVEEKARGPLFLYRKKDGGKIASDGLVSITDIYGDY